MPKQGRADAQEHWLSAPQTIWRRSKLHRAYSALPVLQVVAPLVLTFLVLVLAAAIALWTGASGAPVIWAMLGSVGLMGATTALLQGGLYGLAGLCPPIYVQVRASAYSLPLQTIVRSLWQP